MSVFELQAGLDYDLVADTIHCRADRDGAQVFEVNGVSEFPFLRSKPFRVLAHTEGDAMLAADSVMEREYP